MRVAIVCGHFMPEIGYQETYLARAYSRLGNEVKVFSTTAISPTGKKIITQDYPVGESKDKKYGYAIQRLNATVNLNSKVYARGLKNAVKSFQPDVIIILALAKIFPSVLLSDEFRNSKIVALFGDADEYMDRTSTAKKIKAVFHSMISDSIKKNLYNRAVKYCSRIVLNIPETEGFIRALLNKKYIELFDKKKLKLNLGFDPDNFYFDEHERKKIKTELNISETECVLITSTRINRQKHLEKIIETISVLKRKGYPVHYIIIGFLNDNYEKELKTFIEKQPYPEIFHCFGFLDHEKIRRFYSAADIGLWIKAAISIQEAMGTGLQVILENKPSVNHLLTHGVNGWFFEKKHLAEILEEGVKAYNNLNPREKINNRMRLVKMNSDKLSYDNIAKRIVENL